MIDLEMRFGELFIFTRMKLSLLELIGLCVCCSWIEALFKLYLQEKFCPIRPHDRIQPKEA